MNQASVQTERKTRFPKAAGILLLIAAGFSLFTTTIGAIWLQSGSLVSDAFDFTFQVSAVVTSAFFALIFGVTSSILSLKRKHLGYSIFSIIVVSASALLTLVYELILLRGQGLFWLIYGVPVLILSLVSLVFVTKIKGELS